MTSFEATGQSDYEKSTPPSKRKGRTKNEPPFDSRIQNKPWGTGTKSWLDNKIAKDNGNSPQKISKNFQNELESVNM